MANHKRKIRFFHRHVNFSSHKDRRKACIASLKHSFRIKPPAGSVKKLEWNPDLSENNLLFFNNKIHHMDENISDEMRLKIINDIAPKTQIEDRDKLMTKRRQYRKKLRDLAKSLRNEGNECGATFLEQLVEKNEVITPEDVKDYKRIGSYRIKQRLNMINTFALTHNKLVCHSPNLNCTYLQEGIFKVPHKWGVTSDDISLREYVGVTKQFLEHYFPEHKIKAILAHDDERDSDEKTGAHTHYFLDGRNIVTGEFDLRKRQIEVVNEYLTHIGRKDEALPSSGSLIHQQTKFLGHYWQLMVQDFMNARLFNPKGFHVEFTEDTEKKTEQYRYMVHQAKLPKSQRDFNYQTRIIDKLKAEILELNQEQTNKSNKHTEISNQLENLLRNLKLKSSELEKIEVKKNQYQQELQEAVNRYVYLEKILQEKDKELAHVEMLLEKKEAEVADMDARTKQQIKEIIVDAYMLMQAKHKKFPRAAREFTEQIAEKLDFDVSSEIRPLLIAAGIDIDLLENARSNRNDRGRDL